jgi:quercetin dioxygenase-like cupin family protein
MADFAPASLDDQPFGVEINTADGILVKQMVLKRAGSVVPQHAHRFDHMTMLARGSVQVWENGRYAGEKHAPAGIFIKAGVKHSFVSMEAFTVLYCIHRTDRSGDVEIQAESCLSECGQCLSHG